MYKILTLFFILISVNTYVTSIAYDLAFMSDIAYFSISEINSWSCSLCSRFPVKGQKAFTFPNADTQGFAAYFPKYDAILVSFRGSANIKNWIYNLETTTVSYPSCSGCSVHRGFYYDYKGISPYVKTEVSRLLELFKGAKIILTGHSLGGAMSILCGLDMKQTYGRVDYIYTYGQPRVGNQNFANYLQSQVPNVYRLVNYADMVPHVPPMAFGFRHGGNQEWYTPRGMQTYKQCKSQDNTCSNSLSSTALSTDDHHLVNYEKLKVSIRIVEKMGKMGLKKQDQPIFTQQEIITAEARKVQLVKEVIGEELNKAQGKI